MQVIRNLSEIKNIFPPLALTIGNFDGVHLGHLKILNEVKKSARENGFASAVLTFEPHPVCFLKPSQNQDFRITSLSQKLEIFRKEKIDYVIALHFNQKLAEISPHSFVKEILINSLNVNHLIIGYDFNFGKNREGNFKTLEEFKFKLSEIPPVKHHDLTCSSSNIRKLIRNGEIAQANEISGRRFVINGIVNPGRGLANKLGFPTANISTKPHLVKPKFGVYKTETFIPHLNKRFDSITNFGVKPTLKQEQQPIFETHILDFSSDIYGKKITVEFTDFLREEKKFDSIEMLQEQIKRDVQQRKSLSIDQIPFFQPQ